MSKNALSQYTDVTKEDIDNALDIIERFLQDIVIESKIPSSYEIEKTYGIRTSRFYKYRSGDNKLDMMRLKDIEMLKGHVLSPEP